MQVVEKESSNVVDVGVVVEERRRREGSKEERSQRRRTTLITQKVDDIDNIDD